MGKTLDQLNTSFDTQREWARANGRIPATIPALVGNAMARKKDPGYEAYYNDWKQQQKARVRQTIKDHPVQAYGTLFDIRNHPLLPTSAAELGQPHWVQTPSGYVLNVRDFGPSYAGYQKARADAYYEAEAQKARNLAEEERKFNHKFEGKLTEGGVQY